MGHVVGIRITTTHRSCANFNILRHSLSTVITHDLGEEIDQSIRKILEIKDF